MDVLDLARVLIYRMHEKGLEVFLIKPELEQDPEIWKFPRADARMTSQSIERESIDLQEINDGSGHRSHVIAIEGDWHDIPSIRGIIKHDLKRAKRKIKEFLPDLDKGTFVNINEMVDKVYPHEHSAVVELQEIISHRNMLRDL
ncbi:MAG: hypothetical protein HKN68_01630 [Saprospiraceae bacterium]|nr:hypothetical protein [Saprospiraceae bacterium]